MLRRGSRIEHNWELLAIVAYFAGSHRDRTFQCLDDIHDADQQRYPGQRISTVGTGMGLEQTLANQSLKNLCQQLRWDVVGAGQFRGTAGVFIM